ncbi:hypothetical protein E2C01_061197 [Portunus trituberculatus]|uniref:Uncharacterized protein n=1 Tax=Portunus trituberculatus TaxID=210409 RepID=A0A5B7HCJ1_PORTR|nr:hypothetical protein [Portunus trituberculatus]
MEVRRLNGQSSLFSSPHKFLKLYKITE